MYLHWQSKLSNPFPDARLPLRSILFTSSFTSTFILDDLTLLRRRFEVDHLLTRGVRSLPAMVRGVRSHDATYTWFASLYAVVAVALAQVFGKPSYIVVGGADVMRVGGVRYGPWHSPVKRLLVGWALRHATLVMPVAEALKDAALRLADSSGANMAVVPTGYDENLWVPAGPKERTILCLAGCESYERLLVKGIDILFAAAGSLPDERFILVGTEREMLDLLHTPIPPNVRIAPPVQRNALASFYQRSKVYVQPSRSEGLPNAVCEAMLSGCIPVGSDVGGMGLAIGATGFLVPPDRPECLVDALRSALNAPDELGLQARERICALFPVERRREALECLLDPGRT